MSTSLLHGPTAVLRPRHVVVLPLADGPTLFAFPSAASFFLQVRPPVEHQWGCSSPAVHAGPPHAPVSVFRHRLLQLFQLSIFCKLPVLPISTLEDLR